MDRHSPGGVAPADSLDLAALAERYRRGLRPTELIEAVLARIEARGDDHVWIDRLPRAELLRIAAGLEAQGPAGKPLYGVPFAIKDNIDVAGRPTTAACPAFAYTPARSATVVQRLIDAGAIPMGKTNLDQFATGLNGTRSPYGTPASACNPAYISGGSSSGSAVAVAAGLASFALGTDTAGSGRVPAAFNNVVGLKPTKGSLSTRGVVPACRSLDCVSIFALSCDDTADVLAAARGFDAADAYARHPGHATTPSAIAGTRFGVPRPDQREFFGNQDGARLFTGALRQIEQLGGELVEIDIAPFLETARLLYEGPWVAERYAAIREFFDRHPDALHPVTREIVGAGARPLAAEAFAAEYRRMELSRAAEAEWRRIDALVLPTAPRSYTIAELLAEPVLLNSRLGLYTNFVNLLDLCAIAIPAGFQAEGVPFGVTLMAPAWSDAALCALGDALHRAQSPTMGAIGHPLPARRDGARRAAEGIVRLAVCGAHMSGLPLNHQLAERGGKLVRSCRTAAAYRLFALPGGPPARPGMLRADGGKAIEVEVWSLPEEAFGGFVAAIPAPLAIGTVELEDGEKVKGFLCEPHGTQGARDITEFGGWRAFLAERSPRAAKSA